MRSNSHHDIRELLLSRIQSGEWPLGALIPGEMELAEEYGCARTTVNRALRTLAEDGLVIRKRKGGTRVCQMPVRHAKFEIPVIREQVEATGSAYRHQVIARSKKVPPSAIRTRLQIPAGAKALKLDTLHLADDHPYALEARWVNLEAVPGILNAPLNEISANEWLVKTVPFSRGHVVFSAENVDDSISRVLEARVGAALFVIDRTTWLEDEFITTMKLYYKEGFELHSKL